MPIALYVSLTFATVRYANLKSRTVDLVGDYAGDELFLIEGDSLLYHVFSNDRLDFDPGMQMLHATYLVEHFLRALHQRGCKFHVVFFQNNASLCVPPFSLPYLRSKYLLAREAIIQHLQNNLKVAASSIAVNIFGSYETPAFKEYLQESGTYFFMCHDGSSSEVETTTDSDSESDSTIEFENLGADDEDDTDSEEAYRWIPMNTHIWDFRIMINWFIRQRYNIALIDGLECRDTKVSSLLITVEWASVTRIHDNRLWQ